MTIKMNEDRVVIQVAARDDNDDISNQTTNTHNLNMSRGNDQLLQFDEDSVVNPEFQTSAISVDDNPVDMVTYTTTTSSNTAASCQMGIQMARIGKLKLKRQSTLNGEIIGPTVSNSAYSKNSLNAVQV